MLKPQTWVPALLCATAAASGLAGGYAGTRVVTAPPSPGESPDRALLGREQDFPPSSDWPSHTVQSGRNVLFEDEPSNSEWLSKPTRSAQTASRNSSSSASVRARSRGVETAESAAVETDFAIQSDIDLGSDSTWGRPSTVVTDERSPNAASFADTSEIDAFTDSPTSPPTSATVDFGSGEPAVGAEAVELDQGVKMESGMDWAPSSEPQSDAVDSVSGDRSDTLL